MNDEDSYEINYDHLDNYDKHLTIILNCIYFNQN